MKSKAQPKKSRLEIEYSRFFPAPIPFPTQTYESLEQPSPLRIVPSIATSGAYEEPIQLDKVIVSHA